MTCWRRRRRSRRRSSVIRHRITDWKIKLCDTIADNARRRRGRCWARSGCRPRILTSRTSAPCLTRNGEVVAQGRSDAVLGRSGDVGGVVGAQGRSVRRASFVRVTSCCRESCMRAIDARPGDDFVARFRRARFSSSFFRTSGAVIWLEKLSGPSRLCGSRQYQHRPVVQVVAVGVAGAAVDDRDRPGL